MNRKKTRPFKSVYILLAVAVVIGLFPLASSYAQQFVDTSVTAYQFTDSAVKVRQIMPFYDSGVVVLYNDDSVMIYQQQDGQLLKSRVENLSNVRQLIDETRAVTNTKQTEIWDPYADAYAYSAQTVEGLSNVVAATSHYYVTQEGSQFQIKYFNNNAGNYAEDLFVMQDVKAIADSSTGGILLKNDGTVYCWDGNDKAAVKKDGLADIISIDNNTALSAGGNVYTWGSNVTGKLGNGSGAESSSAAPVKVAGLPQIKAITATESQVYAVAQDGTLYQWGESNAAGYARIAVPQKVSGVTGVKQVFAAAHTHNAAYVLHEDDTVSVLGYSAVDADTLTGLLNPTTAVTSLNKDLSTSMAYSGSLTGMPGGQLTGTAANGQSVTVTVTGWECDAGFNPLVKGDYVFRPVLSVEGNYRVVDSILPRIIVKVQSGAGQMTSDTYSINTSSNCLSKIAAGTAVSALKEGILANGGTVKVMKEGGEVSGDTPVGTGMTVELYEGSTKVQSLTAVVTGDVNGDGKISSLDVVQIKAHVLGKSSLSGNSVQAACINDDDKVSSLDYIMAKAYVLGKGTIVPR